MGKLTFLGLIVLAAILFLLSSWQKAYAAEVVYHIGAHHTGDFEYNNRTDGVGVRWKDVGVGTYTGSYAPKGMLDGTIIYVSKRTQLYEKGSLTLGSDLAITYGYPEFLKGNKGGLMVVPALTAEVGNKKYAVAISMVPGQLVGNDSAYLLSVVVK